MYICICMCRCGGDLTSPKTAGSQGVHKSQSRAGFIAEYFPDSKVILWSPSMGPKFSIVCRNLLYSSMVQYDIV